MWAESAVSRASSFNRKTTVKLINRSSLLLCASSVGLVAGCVTDAPRADDLVFQAPLGTTTYVYAQVEARAACIARPVDQAAADPEPLYADTTGWIRFGVMPSPTELTTRALLDCTGPDGSVVERAVMFETLPSDATPHNVEPPAFPRLEVPALAGDPMAPTQDELAARGYPQRPDPVESPARYARWLRAVSTPKYIPLAEPIAGPSRHRPKQVENNSNSYNWSGAETNSNPGDYAWIDAVWNVPTLSNDPARAYSVYHESAWPGLGDGDGNDNLIQAGVADEYDALGNGTFLVYHQGWYESLGDPGNGGQMNFPSSQFPIAHSDEVGVEVAICNSDGTRQADAVHSCMSLENYTENWLVEGAILPIGGAASTVNNRAEWIVERPSDSGSYGLTNYGSVTFEYLGPSNALGAPLVTMINSSGQTMSQAAWDDDDLVVTYVRSE